jgi:gliding motility-associated-like protein
VPNYSFEDTIGSQCQSQMGISNLAVPIVKNWQTNHSFSTPDYYNSCANSIWYPNMSTIPYSARSYQSPRNGFAYIGIGTYFIDFPNDSINIGGEYISVKLTQPLKANSCYYTEFYANLGNLCIVTTNQLSMLLSQTNFTTAPYSYTNSIQPQVQWDTTQYFTDTLNWVKIAGTFVAQGGEQYLTIGNFKDGAYVKKIGLGSNFTPGFGSFSTRFFTYFLIDDVSLYELPNHSGTQSYTLCAGDSLLLGDTTTLPVRYQWSLNNIVIDTLNHIIIKPTQTTIYVLQTKHCSTQTQTITITVNDCTVIPPIPITEPVIPNVFTPNGDGINDTFNFSIVGASNINFNIYNRWGNIIQNSTLASHTYISWDGRTTSGIECASGIYFYTLQYTDAKGDLDKKNGYITLIK